MRINDFDLRFIFLGGDSKIPAAGSLVSASSHIFTSLLLFILFRYLKLMSHVKPF
jgi:hypothetical protein